MKRFIVVFVLLAVSAGAQAEWAKVYSNSRGTSYLWYPVKQHFPWAYPVGGAVFKQPTPIVGWRYRARSMLSEATVDCRDGRLKLRRGTLYSGSNLNGHWVRAAWLILNNGLKVVPGRWYGYGQVPSPTRKVIRLACSGLTPSD